MDNTALKMEQLATQMQAVWEAFSEFITTTKEELSEAFDEKIAKKKNEIAALEEQKEKFFHLVNMRTILAKVKKSGLTPQEIAEKLGLEI